MSHSAQFSKKHYFLEIHIDYSMNCKQKVVQAAIIIFLNYKIFSTRSTPVGVARPVDVARPVGVACPVAMVASLPL